MKRAGLRTSVNQITSHWNPVWARLTEKWQRGVIASPANRISLFPVCHNVKSDVITSSFLQNNKQNVLAVLPEPTDLFFCSYNSKSPEVISAGSAVYRQSHIIRDLLSFHFRVSCKVSFCQKWALTNKVCFLNESYWYLSVPGEHARASFHAQVHMCGKCTQYCNQIPPLMTLSHYNLILKVLFNTATEQLYIVAQSQRETMLSYNEWSPLESMIGHDWLVSRGPFAFIWIVGFPFCVISFCFLQADMKVRNVSTSVCMCALLSWRVTVSHICLAAIQMIHFGV